MVNNYPEYAAGVSYQKAEQNVKHFYNAQVKVDPSDDSLSALLTKDGVVIAELPDGGGSSDFSTAEVKFICSNAPSKIYYVKYITTSENLGIEQREEIGTSEEFAVADTIVLYNGFCILPWADFTGVSEESIPTATGDIELDLSKGFIVRGNGTITCEGTETPSA